METEPRQPDDRESKLNEATLEKLNYLEQQLPKLESEIEKLKEARNNLETILKDRDNTPDLKTKTIRELEETLERLNSLKKEFDEVNESVSIFTTYLDYLTRS